MPVRTFAWCSGAKSRGTGSRCQAWARASGRFACVPGNGAYRVFYVVEDARSVYVLHAFQKKTQKTSKADIDTGKRRYASIP